MFCAVRGTITRKRDLVASQRIRRDEITLDSLPVLTTLHKGPQMTAERTRDRLVSEDVMDRIEAWSKAYPLDIFPEPDFAKARGLLAAGGITIDAVSASNMRHVITRVWEMLQAAPAASPEWVSVSERLPDEQKDVLAFDGRNIFMAKLSREDGHEDWYADGEDDPIEPTHWLPLPSAPVKP